MPCSFEATRRGPFGCYAICSCGWVSRSWADTHAAAWEQWQEHKREAAA